MPERHISPNQLPEAIRRAIGAIDTVGYPAQGMTSQVMTVHAQRGAFVVKRATQPRYQAWLQREHAVLRALAETDLPVPRAYLLVPAVSPASGAWLLMSYIPGQTLRAALRAASNPLARQALLQAFGRLLQSVHTCRLPSPLDQEQLPWLDRMLGQAAHALQHDVVDGTPELLAYVQQNRPARIQETLIHGDCTLDNVLVQGQAVCGLIDWAGGGSGDPRYDLALATQAEREAFQSAGDYDAFYAGYAGERLAEADRSYLMSLDEFF